MAITRRITTSTSEPLYNEGDVIAKSTNGLPTYGMTEADMQALQSAQTAQASPQAAQLAAEIVSAARNGNIAPQGNVSPQGGVVTYGGSQRGGVTVLPDIRGDGDGVWLANMAPGRPIDLGPTAGWAGFNGQGQFVGYPSGMPHVLYGGFMDTLAPFMQYLSPMFQQARANVAQAPAAPAVPAAPGRTRRRQDTTPVDDTPMVSGPVSRDLNDNDWNIRTPATDWLDQFKTNMQANGVDVTPTPNLVTEGPFGNQIRFAPEQLSRNVVTDENGKPLTAPLMRYAPGTGEITITPPATPAPVSTEPTFDMPIVDGFDNDADYVNGEYDVIETAPLSAGDAASAFALAGGIASAPFGWGLGWLGRLMGLGKGAKIAANNAQNIRRLVQPSVTNAQRAANEARISSLVGNKPAPTAVRADVPVSTPAASPASLADRMRTAPPGSMPAPFQSAEDLWRASRELMPMPQRVIGPVAPRASSFTYPRLPSDGRYIYPQPRVPQTVAQPASPNFVSGYGFQGSAPVARGLNIPQSPGYSFQGSGGYRVGSTVSDFYGPPSPFPNAKIAPGYTFQGAGSPFNPLPQSPIIVTPRPGFTFQGQSSARAIATPKKAAAPRKTTTAKKTTAEKKPATRRTKKTD